MGINRHISVVSAVFVFLACFWSSYNAQASLIDVLVNDGFETGDFTGWSEPTVNPNPWTVVSTISHTGTFSAYNPAKSTAISATTLSQSFAPTLADNIAAADLWYFHEGGLGTVGLATLLTFSDGSWVQDTLFAADPLYKQNQWSFHDLMPTLLASSGKYLVEIGFFPKFGGSQYIDDVSVSAVPIPAAAYLFVSGLIGIIGMLNRKS